MDTEWNDRPIYRQLRDRVVARILDGDLREGDPLPSVRTVSSEYRVNPLTVLKGYQQLANEGLVEARRGLGMFVKDGAAKVLLQGERERFLDDRLELEIAESIAVQRFPGPVRAPPCAPRQATPSRASGRGRTRGTVP